jgi:predicted AAA+ superfamily ATPase
VREFASAGSPSSTTRSAALEAGGWRENSWQRTGGVPATLGRPIERPLGSRRVGKTTALYQTVRHLIAADMEPTRIWWLRLDHPLLLQENLGDLVRAVLSTSQASPDAPLFLMLDEIVYTDRWDLWLKTFFDEQWPVRIAATSSATAALRERRLESGVGRWSEQHLTPYLFTEFLALVGQDRPVEVGDSLADSLSRLRHGQRADQDLAVLAAQITGVLSPSNICGDLGLSQPTFDHYLSYLEQAFLVFTLPNYSGREATVQKRGRKLYFVDGAIRNAALQRGLAPLDNPTELGVLLENLVAATVRSLALHTGVRLYHWRDGKHEVDLVFDHPDQPLAFEIGSSPDHPRTGIAALHEKHPRFRGRCYFVAPQVSVTQPTATPSGIGTLPLDLFLQVVGAQADAALAASLGARPLG